MMGLECEMIYVQGKNLRVGQVLLVSLRSDESERRIVTPSGREKLGAVALMALNGEVKAQLERRKAPRSRSLSRGRPQDPLGSTYPGGADAL